MAVSQSSAVLTATAGPNSAVALAAGEHSRPAGGGVGDGPFHPLGLGGGDQ
jgi:hypothetical protein